MGSEMCIRDRGRVGRGRSVRRDPAMMERRSRDQDKFDRGVFGNRFDDAEKAAFVRTEEDGAFGPGEMDRGLHGKAIDRRWRSRRRDGRQPSRELIGAR